MAHWFPERIEQLCKELKVTKSRLGQEAGLSHATISKWIRAAETGDFNPRLTEVEKLARHTGRPATWFLFERVDAARVEGDTKAAADKAARRLTEFDGVPAEEAWSLIRKVVSADWETQYFEARAILGAQVGKHHQRSSDEIKAGAVSSRSVKTS